MRAVALLAGLAAARAAYSGPVGSAFNPSSLLVSRVGRVGSLEPLTTTGSVTTYVDEFAPNGTLLQSLLVPALTLWTPNPMTCLSQYLVGSPMTIGLLTRSVDATAVSINGPSVVAGTAYVSSVAGGSVPEKLAWTFAFMNAASAFDTSSQVIDHYAGDLFSNAVSNGTGFYAAGAIGSSTSASAAGYSVTYFPAGYAGANNEGAGNTGMEVAHYFGAVRGSDARLSAQCMRTRRNNNPW